MENRSRESTKRSSSIVCRSRKSSISADVRPGRPGQPYERDARERLAAALRREPVGERAVELGAALLVGELRRDLLQLVALCADLEVPR
jgi:hypothetical protein